MKKTIALSLIALTALALAPNPALASRDGDKAAAAIGGFIGGIIVGSAINDHDRYPDHGGTRVIVDRGYDRFDRGYWKEVRIRSWVPGYWTTDYRHGRRVRIYVEGHYEFRTDRVWVSYDRHDRRDRYGYGYSR